MHAIIYLKIIIYLQCPFPHVPLLSSSSVLAFLLLIPLHMSTLVWHWLSVVISWRKNNWMSLNIHVHVRVYIWLQSTFILIFTVNMGKGHNLKTYGSFRFMWSLFLKWASQIRRLLLTPIIDLFSDIPVIFSHSWYLKK